MADGVSALLRQHLANARLDQFQWPGSGPLAVRVANSLRAMTTGGVGGKQNGSLGAANIDSDQNLFSSQSPVYFRRLHHYSDF